ncbi:hypothetical protein BDV36DRAFT_310532 [Aspergillus pseudocaelatus]|uniref:F-box domain-containing protein n=1 Tax=Aspergillus pseudocaelatus TaxID=1825620 RepID=A0ABQ6WFU7_9EURO|nr:hypothetical protein BDV36DRAFT_310532 [Aspergillus pseudocaelatus]
MQSFTPMGIPMYRNLGKPGRSEIYCHLCGVSFNIARSRKVDEPDTAGWDYNGERLPYKINWAECAEQGCSFAVLTERLSSIKIKYKRRDDPKYVPEEEIMYEPYDEWCSTLLPLYPPRGEPICITSPAKKEHVISPVPENGEVPESSRWDPVEHIPGPTCRQVNAYSGRRISLEEMRGCRTVQCLINKKAAAGWGPDGFDQDWELSGDYFLSGVRDGMPSRGGGSPRLFPSRGGVTKPLVENINPHDYDTGPDLYGMPFHPWCFDIYSQFSYEEFPMFPRVGDVTDAQQELWFHTVGHEYLAANPDYIPKLPAILLATIKEDENFSPHNGAFDLSQVTERHAISVVPVQDSTDPFLSWPYDIQLMMVDFLGSRDIASLRLASRVFRQLPVSLWLWEAWDENECDHTPSIWTTITANDIKETFSTRELYNEVLEEEYEKGELDPVVFDIMAPPWSPTVPDQIKLPRGKTNWYEVYSAITRNWDELKGLKNRRRI